jgi:hypothetical protein
MVSKKGLRIGMIILLFVLAAGCAAIPVREAVKVDMSVPVGKIEGNQFIGLRYPFKVSAPPGWQITTEYPEFMLEFGYEKEGLEESQVFIFNPVTHSNLQIEFSPAGRHVRFSQKTIEQLTAMGAGSLKEELEKDYGKEIQVEISPTERYFLKGVPFAARKYAAYTLKGVKREQGWIYAFAEPYQIFILYMVLEKEGMNDRQDIKSILDSFQVISKEAK